MALLTTARLQVRPWDADGDRQAIVDLFGDPVVVRYIGKRRVPDLAAAGSFLERRLGRVPPGPLGFWAVVDRSSGQVIGSANLDPIPLDTERLSDDVQYGVSLRPEWWGRGLATELGAALLGYADKIGLAEVLAVVEPGNTRSHAMIERLGFTRDGVTTAYYGGEEMVRYRRARGTQVPSPHHA